MTLETFNNDEGFDFDNDPGTMGMKEFLSDIDQTFYEGLPSVDDSAYNERLQARLPR